jgi:hypothetical protein
MGINNLKAWYNNVQIPSFVFVELVEGWRFVAMWIVCLFIAYPVIKYVFYMLEKIHN